MLTAIHKFPKVDQNAHWGYCFLIGFDKIHSILASSSQCFREINHPDIISVLIAQLDLFRLY